MLEQTTREWRRMTCIGCNDTGVHQHTVDEDAVDVEQADAWRRRVRQRHRLPIRLERRVDGRWETVETIWS